MSPAYFPVSFSWRLGLAGLALPLLAACQYYAPNAPLDPRSTEAITIAESERLMDRLPARAPGLPQLRIPTGTQIDIDVTCRDWLDVCWETRGIVVVEESPDLPRLPDTGPAPAQTFRGVMPCLQGAAQCVGQQAVLTLFANQTWRASLATISIQGSVGEPLELEGCWSRTPQDKRVFVLRNQDGNLLAELVASSNNQLRVLAEATGNEGVVRHTLSRQPEVLMLGATYPSAASCGAAGS